MGQSQMLQALGAKVRKQRRRLGFTLDELARKSGISKPYLSLIETGRVANPASDEKLRRLEQTLGFAAGELVSQAHLCRTPKDIRAVLISLMKAKQDPGAAAQDSAGTRPSSGARCETQSSHPSRPAARGPAERAAACPPPASPESRTVNPQPSLHRALKPQTGRLQAVRDKLAGGGIDLDDAYLNGVLHELVERSAGNVEQVSTNAVPVINKVSAGYPQDFTDLSYPPRVADDYVGCPDVRDKDAFAARVHGDSMRPKYQEGDIVIFSPAADLRNGDDCFVRLACGQTTFKRVFFETDDTGQEVIRLQPRNEKYRAQVHLRESITGIYRAIYRYERLDSGE